MPSLLNRWFGVGRLPAAYAALASDPATIFSGESLSMTSYCKHLRSPGHSSSGSVSHHIAAMVLTSDRLVLVFGWRVVLDATYGAAPAHGGALAMHCSGHGLKLDLDAAAAIPDGGGTVEVDARIGFTAQQQARLPHGEQILNVTAEQATALARWS